MLLKPAHSRVYAGPTFKITFEERALWAHRRGRLGKTTAELLRGGPGFEEQIAEERAIVARCVRARKAGRSSLGGDACVCGSLGGDVGLIDRIH